MRGAVMMTPERIAELRLQAWPQKTMGPALDECLDEVERLQQFEVDRDPEAHAMLAKARAELATIRQTCAEVAAELQKHRPSLAIGSDIQLRGVMSDLRDRLEAAAYVPTTPRPLSEHCNARRYAFGILSTCVLNAGHMLCHADSDAEMWTDDDTGAKSHQSSGQQSAKAAAAQIPAEPLPFPVIATDPADDALVDGMLARARAKQTDRWQAIGKRDGVVLATEKTQLAARLVAFSDKSLCHGEVEFAIKPHVQAAEKRDPTWSVEARTALIADRDLWRASAEDRMRALDDMTKERDELRSNLDVLETAQRLSKEVIASRLGNPRPNEPTGVTQRIKFLIEEHDNKIAALARERDDERAKANEWLTQLHDAKRERDEARKDRYEAEAVARLKQDCADALIDSYNQVEQLRAENEQLKARLAAITKALTPQGVTNDR